MIWYILAAIAVTLIIILGAGIYSHYYDEAHRIEQETLRRELERLNSELDTISWGYQFDHHPDQYQRLMDTSPEVAQLRERRIRILARSEELHKLRGGKID